MESLLITPKNEADLKLISDLLFRLNIKVQVLTEEEKEDIGLGILMGEVNRNEKTSREEIMKLLKQS
jgi:hypothetical protein